MFHRLIIGEPSGVYRRALIGLLLVGSSIGCHRYAAPQGLMTHPQIGVTALDRAIQGQSHVVARTEIEVAHVLGTEKVNANLVLRPPGDIRLELLTPTDDFLTIFVANGKETRLFQRGAKECIVQVGCQGELRGLLPVPIDVGDLVSLLLGGGPRNVTTELPMVWNESTGTVVLEEGTNQGKMRRVHLDPCSYDMVSAEWWEKETLSVRAALGDENTVIFQVPGEGVEVKMTFLIQVSEMIVEDDAFTFECPQGVKEQIYRCNTDGREP